MFDMNMIHITQAVVIEIENIAISLPPKYRVRNYFFLKFSVNETFKSLKSLVSVT